MNDDEIILPVQRMFPNCGKYKKCCTKDEDFWEKAGKEVPVVPSPEVPIEENEHEQILHNVNGFKIDRKRDKVYDAPEGFEGW